MIAKKMAMEASPEGIERLAVPLDSADFERHDSTAQLLKKSRTEYEETLPGGGQLHSGGDEEDFSYLTPEGEDRAHRDSADLWMWDDNPQSREVLLALFMMVDKLGDGSGSMSSTELMHVLINLGEDVDDEIADVRPNRQPPAVGLLLFRPLSPASRRRAALRSADRPAVARPTLRRRCVISLTAMATARFPSTSSSPS